MNRLRTSTALLAVLALTAGGAWAGCGGGGGGSRRPAAGSGKPAFKKADLPPAVEVKTFNSTIFEQGSQFLELEEAQIGKIREGRDVLRKEGEEVEKEQNAARAEYNAAQDAAAATAAAAAAKVKAAAKKAEDFDPEKKWDGLLKKELKAEQYKKWKEYEARVKKEMQGEGGGQ